MDVIPLVKLLCYSFLPELPHSFGEEKTRKILFKKMFKKSFAIILDRDESYIPSEEKLDIEKEFLSLEFKNRKFKKLNSLYSELSNYRYVAAYKCFKTLHFDSYVRDSVTRLLLHLENTKIYKSPTPCLLSSKNTDPNSSPDILQDLFFRPSLVSLVSPKLEAPEKPAINWTEVNSSLSLSSSDSNTWKGPLSLEYSNEDYHSTSSRHFSPSSISSHGNPSRISHFSTVYQKIYHQQSQISVFSESEIIENQILFLLQGLPTDIFYFDRGEKKFKPKYCRLENSTVKSLFSVLLEFADYGSKVYHLDNFLMNSNSSSNISRICRKFSGFLEKSLYLVKLKISTLKDHGVQFLTILKLRLFMSRLFSEIDFFFEFLFHNDFSIGFGDLRIQKFLKSECFLIDELFDFLNNRVTCPSNSRIGVLVFSGCINLFCDIFVFPKIYSGWKDPFEKKDDEFVYPRCIEKFKSRVKSISRQLKILKFSSHLSSVSQFSGINKNMNLALLPDSTVYSSHQIIRVDVSSSDSSSSSSSSPSSNIDFSFLEEQNAPKIEFFSDLGSIKQRFLETVDYSLDLLSTHERTLEEKVSENLRRREKQEKAVRKRRLEENLKLEEFLHRSKLLKDQMKQELMRERLSEIAEKQKLISEAWRVEEVKEKERMKNEEIEGKRILELARIQILDEYEIKIGDLRKKQALMNWRLERMKLKDRNRGEPTVSSMSKEELEIEKLKKQMEEEKLSDRKKLDRMEDEEIEGEGEESSDDDENNKMVDEEEKDEDEIPNINNDEPIEPPEKKSIDIEESVEETKKNILKFEKKQVLPILKSSSEEEKKDNMKSNQMKEQNTPPQFSLDYLIQESLGTQLYVRLRTVNQIFQTHSLTTLNLEGKLQFLHDFYFLKISHFRLFLLEKYFSPSKLSDSSSSVLSAKRFLDMFFSEFYFSGVSASVRFLHKDKLVKCLKPSKKIKNSSCSELCYIFRNFGTLGFDVHFESVGLQFIFSESLDYYKKMFSFLMKQEFVLFELEKCFQLVMMRTFTPENSLKTCQLLQFDMIRVLNIFKEYFYSVVILRMKKWIEKCLKSVSSSLDSFQFFQNLHMKYVRRIISGFFLDGKNDSLLSCLEEFWRICIKFHEIVKSRKKTSSQNSRFSSLVKDIKIKYYVVRKRLNELVALLSEGLFFDSVCSPLLWI